MQLDSTFYFDRLYPLQDKALSVITKAETGFYLTGGTVVSRVDLMHRFSDDLDLFVNWNTNYTDWCSQIIEVLKRETQWTLSISMRQPYFTRLFLDRNDISLKIELVNDVLSHVGEIRNHAVFGRIDSPENILAHKLCTVTPKQWEQVRWIEPPDCDQYIADLFKLGEDLILVK